MNRGGDPRAGTASYYEHLFPCLRQRPRVFADHNDFVFSDIVLPKALPQVRGVPHTQSHIIGVIVDTQYAGVKYRNDGGRWQSIDMRPGQFRLAAAHQNAVEWRWNRENIWGRNNQLVLHFSPQRMARIALEVFDIDEFNIDIPHMIAGEDPLIKQLFLSLREEMTRDSEPSLVYQESVMQMLCTHLLSRYCHIRKAPPPAKGGLDPHLFRRVVEYMREHFNQDVSLETLASLCSVSAFRFTQLFKASTGCSPHQYLVNIRLHQAMALLRDTELNIEIIAFAVGYNNPFYFARLFRKYVGESPGAYRRLSR